MPMLSKKMARERIRAVAYAFFTIPMLVGLTFLYYGYGNMPFLISLMVFFWGIVLVKLHEKFMER